MGLLGDVIGGVTGVLGYNQAKQNAKGQRGAIKRAYQMATLQRGIDQANTRQDTNESLNARGVLAAGAPRTGAPLSPIGRSVAASGAYRDLYNRAQGGNVGASNTIGGQVNANLGDQFYREGKDQYDTTQQALHDVNASEMNGILGAVTSGVQTAMNVNAGQQAGGLLGAMQGAFGMPVNLQPSPNVGTGGTTAPVGSPMPWDEVMRPPSNRPAWDERPGATMNGDSRTANYDFNVG